MLMSSTWEQARDAWQFLKLVETLYQSNRVIPALLPDAEFS
jgi:hypothetical protein